MSKDTGAKYDALVFIDTNVYLDFYRTTSDFESPTIKHLGKCSDKIITTHQVLMEYKKNRQKVILDSVKIIESKIKLIQETGGMIIGIPSFLSDLSLNWIKMFNKNEKGLQKDVDELRKGVSKGFKSPGEDLLYKYLSTLFKNDRTYHLNDKDNLYSDIIKLAHERFLLGYPPRKNEDISYGDAINWEWIIHCAVKSEKDIIIVSRDNDYGAHRGKESYLNDWLKHEFEERVGIKKNIILTDRLIKAFKMIGLNTTEKEEQLEDELINNLNIKGYLKTYRFDNLFSNNEFIDIYKRFTKE